MDPEKLKAQGLDPNDFITTGPVTRDTFVTYYVGKSTLSGVPAVLHWAEGDVITLAQVDDNGIEQDAVFKVPVSEIQSVSKMSSLLNIKVAGKMYKLGFEMVGRKLPKATGLSSGIQPNRSEPNLWWLGELKLHGVKVTLPKQLVYVAGAFGVLAIIVLLMVLFPKK